MYKPTDEITKIPLIGESKAIALERLGISTINDLLFHIPNKYKDSSNILSIVQFKQEKQGAILAKVVDIKNAYTRSRKVLTRAQLEDETGKIYALWFNQPYLAKAIHKGSYYLFQGKIPEKAGSKDISNPEYELYQEDQEQVHLGKISPYYPETEGVSSKWLRARLKSVLGFAKEIITDNLPQEIQEKENLLDLPKAISFVHIPKSLEEIEQGRKRLGFDEMLQIAIKMEEGMMERKDWQSPNIDIAISDISEMISKLPFEMTNDQKKALEDILNEMSEKKAEKTSPMRKLLNGDVGSGKTIVAALAMYATIKAGYSACLMAPTSILANQHFDNISKLFSNEDIEIDFLASKRKVESKSNKARIVIGTHAILYNQELPDNFGLIIIDEQHRFGVGQRNQLIKPNKDNLYPHYLSMTATPIPRTLTNVLFGDMSASFIHEMPKNRIPIETHYVPSIKRKACYEWITKRITDSNYIEQAFIVFPLIEESSKTEAKAATKEFEVLSKSFFKTLKVGLLHGQMKEEEKEEVLKSCRDKDINILISTSVIEVGIDFKDATIMVIENAERFGLAQLHQFRGRVGRGILKSYCYVLAGENLEDNEKVEERLQYFSTHNSGFDVAEYDLEHRGPGEVYGLKQSGIPNFKVAKITDMKLLIQCRDVAKQIINKGYNIEKIIEGLFH